MGATQSQINSFVSTYAPYATQAGNSLGVSPSSVLAQWGLESAYGTAPNAVANNNFAGIMQPGTQSLQSFTTPQAFEQSYVSTVQNNFPNAENTGADLSAFINGLIPSSGLQYSTTPEPTYFNRVAGVLSNLTNAGVSPSVPPTVTPGPVAGATPSTGFTPSGGGAGLPTAACSGLTGFFSWGCWQGVAADFAFVIIGVLIFIVAVASGLFSEVGKKVTKAVTS